MQNKTKYWVAGLSVSTAFFMSLIQYEGYRAKPYRDSVGVPTIGIGTTQYPDGSRVKMTDNAITKEQAITYARAHVSKDEIKFRHSLPNVALGQNEYDAYMSFLYQFGAGNWNKSSMRRELLKGNHKAACQALLRYKYAGGRDCSIRKNNCYGVWTRQKERYKTCMLDN